METVVIQGKGPKMLKLADGRFVGVSKPLTLDAFERGNSYSVEITKNGRFENIVKLGDTAGAPTKTAVVAENGYLVNQAVASVPNAKPYSPKLADYKPANANGLSKEEWAAKDERISRQGLYQAALQSPIVANLCLTVDGLDKALALVRQAAEDGLDFVNKGK